VQWKRWGGFRGAYLRLARVPPLAEAQELREQFIQYAAQSGDHSASDDFIRIFKEREIGMNLASNGVIVPS